MFNTQQNKKIVWDLMVDNNVFADINPQHFDNIKREFEVKMNKLAALPLSVIALNKQCLTEMLEDVSKYKTVVTAAALQQLRDATFNKGLQSKQNEFKALNARPAPPSIDFSDKEEDKPIGSELDAMLAKTIAWREKELNFVIDGQDLQAASKWINPQAPTQMPSQAAASTQNPSPAIKLLKIGEDIPEPMVAVVKKKVNFITEQDKDNDAPLSDTLFLASLKSKLPPPPPLQPPSDTILERLNEIVKKQEEILSLLKSR